MGDLDVYRVGWYGGSGGQLKFHAPGLTGAANFQTWIVFVIRDDVDGLILDESSGHLQLGPAS